MLDDSEYKRYEDALLQIMEFSDKVYYELAKGKVTGKMIRVFCKAWREISLRLPVSEEVEFYSSLQTALKAIDFNENNTEKRISYKDIFTNWV